MLIQQIAETVPGGLDPESGASMEDLSDLQAIGSHSSKFCGSHVSRRPNSCQTMAKPHVRAYVPLCALLWRMMKASLAEFQSENKQVIVQMRVQY